MTTGVRAEPNVTPMIDVMLVLLIIMASRSGVRVLGMISEGKPERGR